ncbi:hypothetical protein MHYP_G00093790 [Metynnis hypsauchen]
MAHSWVTAAEALLHIQESLALESEEDFSSSDESGEDSEEERLYFEKRIDPKEDFCNREPGVQLRKGDCYTPLSLFKLFFPEDAVEVLCQNTNKQAAKNIARGAKYRWMDIDVAELYQYIGLIIYMSMVRLKHISDFWQKSNIFSIPFPSQVMSRDRYRTISWNIHMSDPDEDRLNDAKRGTSEHDRLFRCKPLMNTVQNAYSSNGYTVDFSVYTGKNNFPTGQGLSYDSVCPTL